MESNLDTGAGAAGPLLELSGIEREFALGETRIRALHGIDLAIVRGEFLAIWGPSGSGKSTLLNILGLIDAADRGTLKFEGEDVGKLSDDALSDCRNRKIGFVFQNFNLVPVLSALENVMLPLQVQGVNAAECKRRAQTWLEHVGLGAFSAFRHDRLSVSAWPSPAPWSARRACSSPTSPPLTSTPRPATKSST
ncbi:MAG: ATP-binding cassette domain-containing protein [Candidatus Protistobacter heckmanni]|nr:ATP-binding cassette domain-containing protein [Candidatus Protistobacter heckmanni]